MAVIRHSFTARPIPADLLARWRQVPPAIAGDCLNRDHCMTGRIAPLAPGMAITGPARTVTPMAGDNAAIHVAIALIEPGDVLVIGGGGDININAQNNSVDNSTGGGSTGGTNFCASYNDNGVTRQGSVDGVNCIYGSDFVSLTNPIEVAATDPVVFTKLSNALLAFV